MIDFVKLLPEGLKGKTWGYLYESFVAFLQEEVKENYVDRQYLLKPDIFALSIDDIKEILYKYGDSYKELTGYSSSLEYFRRRLFTLNSRIQYRKLPQGYQEVFFLYGYSGNAYPMLLNGDNLTSWEEFYGVPEIFEANATLDTGWFLDEGATLDSAEIFNLLVNHSSIEYNYNYIEKAGYFTTKETFNAFLHDIKLQKQAKDIPHFEINLDIYANVLNLIGDPLLTTYTTIDKSVTSNQSTYYNTGSLTNYSTLKLSYNGTGDQDFTIVSAFEVVQDSTVLGVQILKLKQLVQYNTSINTFNEITLFDGANNIIVKSTVPIVELPSNLTSVQLNFYLE